MPPHRREGCAQRVGAHGVRPKNAAAIGPLQLLASSFPADSTMPAAARAIVSSAQQLYGKSAARQVLEVFRARGIL